MIRLFIEGTEVAVRQSTSVLLTVAIDDIRITGARDSSFSKTFWLDGNKETNKHFGNVYDVTVANDYDPTKPNKGTNFNAGVAAKCYLFNDSIQCFKGICRLLQVQVSGENMSYELYLIGELGGFAAKLGSSKLEELDFSEYNHDYTIANILASKANVGMGAGYVYPLIDYGTYGMGATRNDWKFGTYRPALHAKEYIEKIAAFGGRTLDFPFLSTDMFKTLLVPHNQKDLLRKSALQLDVSAINVTTNGNEGDEVLLHFNTLTTLGGFTASSSNGQFTYSGTTQTGLLTFTCSVAYENRCAFAILCYLRKNASTVIASEVIGTGVGVDNEGLDFDSGTKEFTFTLPSHVIASGDYLRLTFYVAASETNTQDFTITVNNARLTYGNTGNNYVKINLGEAVVMNDVIPRGILMIDFISWICKLFNILLVEDPENDNKLIAAPWYDYYSKTETKDWSKKLDLSKDYIIKPLSQLNARYYQFSFKDDSDYYNDLYKKRYNKSYGSLIYDSAFEFAKDTEKIEIGFSGTPLVGYEGQVKVFSTIYKKNNNNEENTDSNIRLLQAKLITGVPSWNIYDAAGTTVLSTQTEYIYAGHLNNPDNPTFDLNFGVPEELFFTLLTGALNVNAFNVFWSAYMAERTNKDAKMLIGTFKLTFKDLAENPTLKYPVYLMGANWLINKIIDFNASKEETCKVELIKITNKIY
jgi:hypothetical protein